MDIFGDHYSGTTDMVAGAAAAILAAEPKPATTYTACYMKKEPKTCNGDFCYLQLHTFLLNIDLNIIFPAQDLFFSRGKKRSFLDLQILGTFTTQVCFPARHTANVL